VTEAYQESGELTALSLLALDSRYQGQARVWLGCLSGFEVGPREGDVQTTVYLYHRCGWKDPMRWEGICADGTAYLGNLILSALLHVKAGCQSGR
jgi:hypothetical protein